MYFLYNIGVRLYGFSIWAASITGNNKAKKWIVGRKDYFERLPDLSSKRVVWFHCASLGEFDQGIPLMNRIKKEDPSLFLLVTFFSPSGMDHFHKRDHTADHATYLPLDTPSNARKFIARTNPIMAFFVKYEFWYNFIVETKKNNSKIYNISGIFRDEQRFFKWYGGLFRELLSKFDWLFVQNESSKKLLADINIQNVTVTGDSRFDKVIENKKNVSINPELEKFKNHEKLLIIGSSWPEDEAVLTPWIKTFSGKTIVAPHDISEKRIAQIQTQLPGSIRYTDCKPEDLTSSKVLILDTIGQLSNAYSYGEIAYVGGGFSGNLHNILEPAVFGLPVIHGPKHTKFPEAQAFELCGFGFSISSTEDFTSTFNHIDNNYDEVSEKATLFVAENAGASDKIYSYITSN